MAIIKVDTDDLLSVTDTAILLKRPRVAIYRMITRGEIQSVKLGGMIYVPRSEIERIGGQRKETSI
jgi:excisionase family DNA binding protein